MWRQQELQELEARGFSLKQVESLADHNMRFMYICRAAQQVGDRLAGGPVGFKFSPDRTDWRELRAPWAYLVCMPRLNNGGA